MKYRRHHNNKGLTRCKNGTVTKQLKRIAEKLKISFVIAHRLSTIKDADLILVMNNGDIVEQGNHEELIAANGFYTNLYNSQFQRTI